MHKANYESKACAGRLLAIFCSIIALLCFFTEDYSRCAAPIHIFMLIFGISFPLSLILERLLKYHPLSHKARNKLDDLYYAISGPVIFCNGVLGLIMSIMNSWKTPECHPTCPYEAIYFWILFSLFIHIPFSIVAYKRFKNWWSLYRNINRNVVRYHPNRELNGVQKGLMEVEEDDEMKGISDGLLQADNEQLQRKRGKREKTCPLCCVDFEIGVNVVDMPNCLHTFHKKCIGEWWKDSYSCPSCRGDVAKGEQRRREREGVQEYLANSMGFRGVEVH